MNATIRKTLACTAAAAVAAFALPVAAQDSNQSMSTSPKAQAPAAVPVLPAAAPLPADDAYYGTTWKRLDANNDGRVSRAEYLAYHGSRWDSYDNRKRGYMDRNETRRLVLEREMSKTDGTPMGDPQNPTTRK